MRHETGTMMRVPMFDLTAPSANELQRVLWRAPAMVATYLIEPDEAHVANAYLYICTDREYTLDKLAPAMRRNVRRGLKELEIMPITSEQILAYGYHAYRDFLRRAGLRAQTEEEFHRYVIWRGKPPGHVFLGAWKQRALASFLTVTELDEWVEIDGCFSADSLLHLRPNDALFFYILSHYMNNDSCRPVSYGVSSLQAVSNKDGLHIFKTKVGFQAKPVHRVFALHPLLRPLANRLTLWGIKTALRLKPDERALKKAEGMLASMLRRESFAATQSIIPLGRSGERIEDAKSAEEALCYRRRRIIRTGVICVTTEIELLPRAFRCSTLRRALVRFPSIFGSVISVKDGSYIQFRVRISLRDTGPVWTGRILIAKLKLRQPSTNSCRVFWLSFHDG